MWTEDADDSVCDRLSRAVSVVRIWHLCVEVKRGIVTSTPFLS